MPAVPALRPIMALDLPDLVVGGSTDKPPIFETVDPKTLLVDETYQRGLSERSTKLIRKIVANWDWRRFKPPTVVFTDGGIRVLDGQHTAIAAATHPGIDKIPVQVVEAPETAAQAAAFIGINRDRLNITATQLHVAGVAAGDGNALAVEEAARAAGVTILKAKPGNGFKPGQSMAVAAMAALVKTYGPDVVAQVLKLLVRAERAPITAADIRAMTQLLTVGEFMLADVEDYPAAIKALGVAGDREAAAFAATHRLPGWKGLASVWFKKVKKRRQAATPSPPTTKMHLDRGAGPAAMPEPAPIKTAVAVYREEPPARQVVNVTAALMGDPPRDRSALAAVKREPRPARGGWKPGVFSLRCTTCDGKFIGHKSATTCEACAYEGATA